MDLDEEVAMVAVLAEGWALVSGLALRHIPTLAWVEEVYPDVAITLGVGHLQPEIGNPLLR